MKIVTILGLIALLLTGCENNTTYNDLKLNAKIIDVGWDDYNEPVCFQFVKIELKNYSNAPKSMWIMTCSWEDCFITDVDNIRFLSRECTANYPTQVQLKPNESISFSSILSVPDSIRGSHFFRIGFVMYSETDLKEFTLMGQSERIEYLKNIKTYWSDSLPILPRPNEYKGYIIN